METNYAISARNIEKSFKGFKLDVEELDIPMGYATALIGENGAGKSTLLNILTGIRLDNKGTISYYGKYTDKDREKNPDVKESIGYTGPGTYYMPQWSIKDIEDISALLFKSFSREKFKKWCEELAVYTDESQMKKKNSNLSDGTKVKLMLSGVLARDTDMLLMDEPASPLDPLMRDKLCQIIGDYIMEGAGKKTVFFSTHNILDMESITDYAIIMEKGKIVEKGFVEDLKEKYVYAKGELEDFSKVESKMVSFSKNKYGFEGLMLASEADSVEDVDLAREVPTLYQISVGLMKQNSSLVMR